MKKMKTGWVHSDVYLDHDTGYIHPECPDRVKAIKETIAESQLQEHLELLTPRRADESDVERVHLPTYVQRLYEHCIESRPTIDTPECPICQGSFEVALKAVGGVFVGCDAVIEKKVNNAFATVRPPGHHAEYDRAMGFCLFNNVAVGAEYLIREHGMERVAIVDFDVHHGNGTQHIFEMRNDVLFISIHEHPRHLFPGTGYADETGLGKGDGYTLNVPMLPGSDDRKYQQAFRDQILPKLADFNPQFLLVSAGFDAVCHDPLAHINLQNDSYQWITRWLMDFADQSCDGRLVSVLEGGYHLESLKRCVVAHLSELTGASAQVGNTDP